MSKVYDIAGGRGTDKTSLQFKNCDRIQVDFGTSGVTGLNILGRVSKKAEWVELVPTIAVTNSSEVYVVAEMPFQQLIFTDGDNTQIAYAVNIDGSIE